MKKIQSLLLYLSLFLMMAACMPVDPPDSGDDEIEIITSNEGVFILNEGNFMYENASLSYLDFETDEVVNNIFYEVNNLPLGDVAQSMTIHGDIGFIVLNNSGKVYAIDINSYEIVGKITGLTSPRYMHIVNNEKAYITDLYAKAITIVNPSTYTIIGQIDVNNHENQFYQHSTEEMVAYKNFVFTNCWSFDNKILVIDTNSDQVVDSIEVMKQPTSLVIDKNNKLWTVTDGGFKGCSYGWEEPALIRIDAETRVIEEVFYFDKEDSPSELAINGTLDTLYFLNKHVYRQSVDSKMQPELFAENTAAVSFRGFYGLAVDPFTSYVYVSDGLDMLQNGVVHKYNPDGQLINTYKVGLIPSYFCFRNSSKE